MSRDRNEQFAAAKARFANDGTMHPSHSLQKHIVSYDRCSACHAVQTQPAWAEACLEDLAAEQARVYSSDIRF